MKYAIWATVVIVLGSGLGLAAADLKMRLIPWDDDMSARHLVRSVAEGTPHPKAVVDNPKFVFGVWDVDTEGKHDFVLSNQGNAPLKLMKGVTSCSCVLSDLKKPELAPGESTKITLGWKSKGIAGPYYQSGTIFTNDPAKTRLALAVQGRYVTSVQPDPKEITVGQISTDETTTAESRLYCYLPQPLAIERVESTDAAFGKLLESQATPLTTGEMADEKEAKSGIKLRLTLKPGLPLGPFQQTIKVHTNQTMRPVVELVVQGTVVSDISVVGSGWDAGRGQLTLNTVDSKEGLERRLLILTRGPHRKNIQYRIAEVSPPSLAASIGETQPIGAGLVTQTPLTVEIKKGAAPGNYLGGKDEPCGTITIETNHPKVPRLQLRVAFAVEG